MTTLDMPDTLELELEENPMQQLDKLKNNSNRLNRRQFLGSALATGIASTLPAFSIADTAINQSLSLLPADITAMSAGQLSFAIKDGHVSCVEVMASYLNRINRYNPTVNAIVALVDESALLAEARQADKALASGEYRGWMHGIPHAVKDLANVRGMITSRGSPIFADNVAQADSIIVERIRRAGAIFIGKTNVPEFGMGSQSYNPVYGTTRNAYDPALVAGGSSGGAAVGLATQMLPVADGSDMMGSLRNPAAYNNVIGFRPSQGRVPVKSGDLYYHQLGVYGPMGRNVSDTIRLLDTIAGYDSRSPMSLRDGVRGGARSRPLNLKNVKLGWLGDFDGYLTTEPGLMDLCEAALTNLEHTGVRIDPCQPEYDMALLWETWLTLRHWAQSSGVKALYDDPNKRRLLKPEAIWEVEGGLELKALDISRAGVDRSKWYNALNKLFERYDFLVLPSAQVFPFAAEIHWPKSIAGQKMDTYHRWMEVTIGGTLSGCPVVNLPAGFDAKGRPMGLQVIGPMGEDSRVLEFALAYESATNYLDRRPQLTAQTS